VPRRKYDLIERQCQADKAIASSLGQPARRHPCGGNLYLVTGNGFGSWTVQFWDRGAKTVRAKGLGSAAAMNLPQARNAAADFKAAARTGAVIPYQPKGARPVAGVARGGTFADAATKYLAEHANEWTPTERDRRASLLDKPCALIASKSIHEITPQMVADVLQPVWKGPGKKPGSLIRSLIERVLGAWAAHLQLPAYANPALWTTQKHFLSNEAPAVVHQPRMHFEDVPAFLAGLPDTEAARSLRFLILTGVRQGDVLGEKKNGKPAADWSQFNLAPHALRDGKPVPRGQERDTDIPALSWTIPETKNGKRHVVPLSAEAIACLGKPGDGPVFPGSEKLARQQLRLCEGHPSETPGRHAVVHGFRSTVLAWMIKQGVPHDVRESVLAHTFKTDTVAAYDRDDRFVQRRPVMDQWATFCTAPSPSP
jgi:integrase